MSRARFERLDARRRLDALWETNCAQRLRHHRMDGLHWTVHVALDGLQFWKAPFNAYDMKFSWLWKEACYDRNTLPLRIFCEKNKPHLSENVKFKSVLFPVLLPPLILQFSTALTKQPVQIQLFSFSTTKYFQTAKIEDGMNYFVRFPLWYNLLKKMLISRYACFQFRWLLCNSPTTGSIGSACQACTEADQIYGVLNLTESRLLWKVLCYKSVAVFIMSLCSFSECAFCVVKISISSWSLSGNWFSYFCEKNPLNSSGMD